MGEAPPWPGEWQVLGASRLFVRSTVGVSPGDADPAVMIHGLGGQSTNWTDLMGLLTDRVTSWAPDLPGFGHSPPALDGDYSLDGLSRTIVEFLDSGKTPVHLFGNSLGGAIAVRVGATRPDLVRSLVLTSPALPDLRPRRHTVGVPAIALPGVGEQLWRRLAKVPPERQLQAGLQINFGNPALVSQSRRDEAVAEYRRRYELDYAGQVLSKTARGLLRAFLDRGSDGLWRQASRIQCSTLVIYGGRDRLVRSSRAQRAAQTIPGAQIVLLPGIGHVAQMENPELVAHFVRSFLDQVDDH